MSQRQFTDIRLLQGSIKKRQSVLCVLTGKRCFWGPQNTIRLGQGVGGQPSYTGWIMLPIEVEKGKEYVRGASIVKEHKAVAATLDRVKRLVGETEFKPEYPKKSEKP